MPLRANIDANFILVEDYNTLITRDMQERYKTTISNLKSLNEYEADVKTDAGTSLYIIEGIQALPEWDGAEKPRYGNGSHPGCSPGFNGVNALMNASEFSL